MTSNPPATTFGRLLKTYEEHGFGYYRVDTIDGGKIGACGTTPRRSLLEKLGFEAAGTVNVPGDELPLLLYGLETS